MSADFLYELAIALCLVFVLEGMMPFLNPGRWRRMVEQLASVDDRTIRIIGLMSMLAGVIGLYLIH